MAKTSSSKKVARVARSGASKRRVRERPKMGFALTCFVIIVLGTLVVIFARTQRVDSVSAAEQPTAPKGEGKPGDHWHVAYGMYVCDHFLPPVSDVGEDKNGIHTHGDGVIHAHPFNSSAAGNNARLKVFGDQVNMKFGEDSITTPDGTVYDSNSKCGDKPAKVYVYRWPSAEDPTATAEVFDKDFGTIRMKDNFSAMTFAVLPEGTDPASVPKPESVSQLNNLDDLKPGDPGYKPPTGDPSAGLPGGTPGISVPGGGAIPGAGGEIPVTPGGATPAAPGGATPVVPGGATPAAPGGATPAAPGGAAPAAPAGATPAAPANPAPASP